MKYRSLLPEILKILSTDTRKVITDLYNKFPSRQLSFQLKNIILIRFSVPDDKEPILRFHNRTILIQKRYSGTQQAFTARQFGWKLQSETFLNSPQVSSKD